jgi:cellulose synthase/poly-beta-1,6-N-acetylglucosamine synthase-like glycosyltransferase
MRRAVIDEAEVQLRLEASISGLATKAPEVSARQLVPRKQMLGLIAVAGLLGACAFLSILYTAMVVLGAITLLYFAAILYRMVIFVRSTQIGVTERIADEEALAVQASELPIYTVLVPAYRESNVIELLVTHLGRIEYPADKLDIKVLVEADDEETISALENAEPGGQFELVLVPGAEPRTKPKALNFGLGLARGEYVTIYDAEDNPDPLQLRRAAVAFSRLGPEVACLQAKLTYSNPNQNVITRWFTIEYAMWFTFFLPGLASFGAPIPLGGTSNHFRRSHLRLIGAWDPFNVTEDADLGLRMFREGLEVRVLDSVTYEEANSDFVNWVRQRSRWYKGYLQTFLIHMRDPVVLYRDVGAWNMAQFVLFVGGTPFLALVNPAFWLLTIIWFVAHPPFELAVFPAPVYYLGLVCWALGNFAIAYSTIVTCRVIRRPELVFAALVVPFYWMMMSLAAAKAMVQLVIAPTFWEKTVHGLNNPPAGSERQTP